MRLTNLTLDRSRALQVAGQRRLGLVGCLLLALRIISLNEQVEPVATTGRL